MKMIECDVEHAQYPTVEEFHELQRTKGKFLYTIGCIVLFFLKLFGAEEHDFHGICKYYTIGKNWGGLEFGDFFVCGADSSDHIKCHELGHGLQNANVGGIEMVVHWIGSGLRYWWRQISHPTTSYDSWYYEGNATKLGEEYVKRIKGEK